MSTVKTSSGFITLHDNSKVFYEQAGTGSDRPVLLCLPGAMGWGREYSYTLEHFPKYFTVVAFDPRGYGRSQETKREFSPRHFHQDADDVAEVMKKLGHDKYSVLGWSDGGTTGLILAAKQPSCVEKLIAGAANSFISKEDIELGEAIQSNEEVMKIMMEKYMPMSIEMYGEEGYKNLSRQYMENDFAIFERHGGDICMSELKAIKCPTLIIHCAQDELIAPCHPKFLHEHIPNSTLHIVPNEGHFWNENCCEDFHRIVKDFLDGNYIPTDGK